MNNENQNLSSPLDSFPDAEVAHHPSNPQGDHLRKLWSSDFCKFWKLFFSKFCKSSPSGSHQFSLQAAWLVNLKQIDLSSFISNSYSFRVRVQAIWGENSSKCSRHRGFLITLSSPSNVHQCSNNSRKNSFARFMPFHFRYWKSYPQKIWNLTTNASNISRVPGTRHGFDIVLCFILSYALWYIVPQPTIRIFFI